VSSSEFITNFRQNQIKAIPLNFSLQKEAQFSDFHVGSSGTNNNVINGTNTNLSQENMNLKLNYLTAAEQIAKSLKYCF